MDKKWNNVEKKGIAAKKKTTQNVAARRDQHPQQGGYRQQQRFRSSSNASSFRKVYFSKRELQELVEKKSEELILKLSSQIKEFQAAIEAHCSKEIILILRLLMKVSKCLSSEGETKSCALRIMSEIFSSRTPTFHSCLRTYAIKMSTSAAFKENELELICDFFIELLQIIPELCWTFLPVDELYACGIEIAARGILKNKFAIESKLKSLTELQGATKEQHKEKSKRKREMHCWDNAAYRTIRILPQWSEVCNPKPPRELRKSIVIGKYEDWMHYYDVQFRLLREDFIAPLRKGIQDYRQGKVGREVSNVRVYNGVCIMKPLFKYVGLCHEICFDTSRFQRTNWEHSSRLIFGSLLCLSLDGFTGEVLFATVSNRVPDDLRRGKLEVMFQDNAEVIKHLHLKTEFVMVESIAYYEASSHILRSLQTAEDLTMPFTEYIIKNNGKSVGHPNYLRASSENTTYNLKFIIKQEVLKNPVLAQKYTSVDIQDAADWPPLEDTMLDESQLEALKNALTHEVAVVQGPPGTGKTYIGLKIVQALLENSQYWSFTANNNPTKGNLSSGGPILVMCFTNHALDQFLEGIMDIDKNIRLIRIGGRSKNEAIKDCSLNNVMRDKKLVPLEVHLEFVDCASEAEWIGSVCKNEIIRYHDPIHSFFYFNDIKEVISEHHIQSLREIADTSEEKELALEIWLGLYVKNEYLDLSEPLEPSNAFYGDNIIYSDSSDSDSDSDDDYETASSNMSDTDSEESDGNITIAVSREQESRLLEGLEVDYKEMKLKKVIKPKRLKTIQNKRRIFKIERCNDYDTFFQSRTEDLTVTKYSEFEAEDIENLHELLLDDRWELYKYWHTKFRRRILEKLEERCEEYNKACEAASEAKHKKERYALETAHVIGMTTTGAAKYQHVLHLLKPKIVIVEEAAEVLESHIVSALNAGTQHLILIGDHKQLRPKPNDHRLAIEYNLEISLFERLVKNDFPRTTLENQHRMRPEIAELVHPHIYKTLYNHESVEKYEKVKGVCKNMFFIDHNHKEKPSNDMSHANEYESKYLITLCRYLIQQKYHPNQITILVTYTGQLLLMKNALSSLRKEFYGVRLCTVDNFQGEENDIILLSLVRSNENDEIGFLSRDNRVCVALSRAKHGFYCIGNFSMLRKKSRTWQNIVSDMEQKGKFGKALEICCCKHPDNIREIKSPEDFAKFSPNGRCDRDCGIRLKCGHTCPNTCHWGDENHSNVICRKPCARTCPLGHIFNCLCCEKKKCTEKVEKEFPMCGHTRIVFCHEDITKHHTCTKKVEKVIPRCKHTELVPCYIKPESFQCAKIVDVIIPRCGHQQSLECHINPENYNKCDIKVTRQLPFCVHAQEMRCCDNPAWIRCRNLCGTLCTESLHQCEKVCHPGKPCSLCCVRVEQVLPKCGHTHEKYCHEDIAQMKCQMNCAKTCKRDHPCPLRCYQKCRHCRHQVSWTPECGHVNDSLLCFEVDRYVCTKQMEKKLVCGHKRLLPCSEDPNGVVCTVKIDVTLRHCGHTLHVPCAKLSDTSTKIECNEIVEKILNCGLHSREVKCCSDIESVKCSELKLVHLECSHEHKIECNRDLSTYKCNIMTDKILSCGHKKRMLCFEPCDGAKCMEKCEKVRCCGHIVRVACHSNPDNEPCSNKCKKKLFCGHTCEMTCSSICACHWKGTEKLPCGHMCDVTCLQSQNLSAIRCKCACSKELPCGHKCYRLCHEPCNTRCTETVEHTCKRKQHTIKVRCCTVSILGPCKKKCESFLDCKHPCQNRCSEPCTSYCQYKVVKRYPCGHSHKIACSATTESSPCDFDCKQPLSCGHLCNGKCHKCFSTRIHAPCSSSNGLKHFCGLKTRLPCSGLKSMHVKSIGGKFEGVTVGCVHIKQWWKCSSKPPVCQERICGWSCPPECKEPKRCTRPCSEQCDRPVCDQKCSKILNCKQHRCIGLCGEPCINICPHCEHSKFKLKSSSPYSDKQVYIQLPCEHIFTVEEMDRHVYSRDDSVVGLLLCPTCLTPLSCSHRYGNEMKRALKDIVAVKTEIDEKKSNKKQLVVMYKEAKQDPQFEITKMCNRSLYRSFLIALKILASESTSEEEEFLLFLFIKLFQYSQQSGISQNSLAILSNLINFLDTHLGAPKISFQVIHDLLSEFYRLYLQITDQLAVLSTDKVVHRLCNNPHSRVSTREFEQLLVMLSDDQGKKLLAEVNLFYPRILNGVWMKCMAGHYYCLPSTRSDFQLLRARCCQCSKGEEYDMMSQSEILLLKVVGKL